MHNLAPNIIENKNINKTFADGYTAVEDFNLTIKRGEFVTFLGPSGCGKTTTLRMIAGFDNPTSGTILLNGEDITKLPPNKRPINTVFQRYALFPHMNVAENISFGLKQKKMKRHEIDKKVANILKLVDLEGFEDRKIQTLSGGQQQRVAIARALVNEPEILLLDEPLGALDLKMRQEMQLELKAMHEELGITFIYVTHDQEEALTMSDKIVVIDCGEVQQVGTPEDIYYEPVNSFVADFIGESNMFNGMMTGEKKARFCGGDFVCVDEIAVGTPITAVVRPEVIELVEPEQGTIKGTVVSSVFKGSHYSLTIESGKSEIIADAQHAIAEGTVVGICVPPEELHIMLAEDNTNIFTCSLNKDYKLEYNDNIIDIEVTDAISDYTEDEQENLIDAQGKKVDYRKVKVQVEIGPADIKMTDSEEEGIVHGRIIDLVYKGDHYAYFIDAENGHDFVVDDEYLWNMDDYVGLIMPVDKMRFSLKK